MQEHDAEPGYDIIGDVHGYADRLEALLRQLGYRVTNGAYRHPTRTAVFVGDLIDRHPADQVRTVRIVRAMVDAGSAQIVLGNHEFNAVAFATERPDGGHWRQHTEANRRQHGAFLDTVGFGSTLHRELIDWFMTIPLWLDLGDVRIVHACWNAADLDHLAPLVGPGDTLTPELIADGSTPEHQSYIAVERILKGPEIHMDGYSYLDKGGHQRFLARACWWNPEARTLRDAAVIPSGSELVDPDGAPADALPDRPLDDGSVPVYHDPVPVVVGHYWREFPLGLEAPHVACVDYSAGKGGPLVAYRWHHGDERLADDRFVWA